MDTRRSSNSEETSGTLQNYLQEIDNDLDKVTAKISWLQGGAVTLQGEEGSVTPWYRVVAVTFKDEEGSVTVDWTRRNSYPGVRKG